MFCHEEIKLEDIEFGRDGSTCCQLKSLVIRCHKEIQLPSTWQLQLDNLEELTLGNCWWQKFPCFTRLKQLKVIESGRSTLFPFSIISSLQQLHSIKISNCALLEGIVEEEDVRRGNIEASSSRDKKKKKIIKLFRLQYVTLGNLPNLRSFMSGADYECHMPALYHVTIDNCGFSTLFTCSTNLQQLCSLQVSNCRLLEYIVGDVRDDDDDDISKTDDKIIITLSHLCYIILENLPNLKSFGRNSSYDFDVPKLSHFYLLQCPQVENFSSLKTSTGITVYSDWHSNGVEVPDLNDYIKENRKRDDSNLISDEGAAAAGETDDI